MRRRDPKVHLENLGAVMTAEEMVGLQALTEKVLVEEIVAKYMLAIVQGTVHELGGLVWVEDAREGGAAFKIFLPAAGVPAVPAAELR